tara:strand:+ start:561 stop:1820 length:1260 start_codon:yes stop_codon:yes gene_type:complete
MKCAPATKGEKRYCRLCSKKETRNQCAYGGRMWDRYAVKDATKEETEAAAEESGITNGSSEGGEGGMSEHWIDKFEKGILEANKSGDSSLRDWFSKSRSSDGKPGWVQLGGKYAGKPCAKQPGQTTKPKCGSSKMKKNLNKDEEDSAFRRKQKQDPNPNRKGKAINVKTESTQIHEGEKDACYTKVKSRYSVWPSAYASGALVKCRKVGAKNWGNKSKKEEFEGLKSFSEFQSECWKTHKKVGMKMKGGKLVPDCRPKNEAKEYTGPDKEDRKVIKKSDNKDFASKLADYEKNMDPKKRQALKDKATKGMKFTHEGTSLKLFGKTYNRCVKKEETSNVEEGAAWTKKSGKNSEGGLNEKGRKSYEKENPGSDLKAPSKKVGNPRRASFCARMKGMRKRQKPSNNTGDDRLSKSLRAWNC